MAHTAYLPIIADRYGAVVRHIFVVGLDLTGIDMRAQVRLYGDVPGSPLVDLATVTNVNAQGLRLVEVTSDAIGIPTSHVELVINESTMQGLPYAGEIGDVTTLAWDWQVTIASRKRRLAKGEFQITGDGVTGAEVAPTNRIAPYGIPQRPVADVWSSARLTFGEEQVTVQIDGADLVAPLAKKATDAADRATADAAKAGLSAGAAQATARYFTTRAAGEAASANDQAFATDDGAGNVIYYRRTASGSTEIGRAVTPASMAGADGATRVGFRVAPSAPVRTLAEKIAEFVSLKDFGAAGDDVADDTDAIVKAVEHCISTGDGLRVPKGRYCHQPLFFAPAIRQGLRIVGDWSYDHDPADTGSFFRQVGGSDYGWTFDGDSGPFYLSVEGIGFIGTNDSGGGVKIKGRSSIGFNRCGWFGYGRTSYPASALYLTRTDEDFVGVLAVNDSWFSRCAKGILIDKELSNAISITRSRFIDTARPVSIEAGGSCRALLVDDNVFEGTATLTTVVSVDGYVWNFSFTRNYIEQNTTTNNSPLIAIMRSTPGERSRSIAIEDNIIQKIMGVAGASIISLSEASGISVRRNTYTSGGDTDRYWCRLDASVERAQIDLPECPNGVTSHPILNTRLGRTFLRNHWSDEDRPAAALQIRGTGDANFNTTTRTAARYTDGPDAVTLDFDLTLSSKHNAASGFAEIAGLPIVNGHEPASVELFRVSGISNVAPISAILPAGAASIELYGADGSKFDFAANVTQGARLRGRVIYRKS